MFEDFFSNPMTILNPVASFMQEQTSFLSNQLFGSSADYNKILEEQKKLQEEEKKRRALQASSADMQASQAASLILNNGKGFKPADMTQDFLGL